eukprot:TRINITY_DN12822_c0_g1_i1.p1 TRINITY_DN12822_c0_g1~~TRINITY_DN12822_c0_g1_i1.p1  ORF type:complete len:301 (+),score=27.49 TRINITY_DN12822_c0_g1_i1:254-1156(+)
MASYGTTGTTTLFGGVGSEVVSMRSSECSRCVNDAVDLRGLAVAMRDRERQEAARHGELMNKLDSLIDMYANAPYVTAQQLAPPLPPPPAPPSSSSDPTIISVSPIRADPRRTGVISPPRHSYDRQQPRHISPTRHRTANLVDERPSPVRKQVGRSVSNKKPKKKTGNKKVRGELVLIGGDTVGLLHEIDTLERCKRTLEADTYCLQRENDALTMENLRYRERLQTTDTAINKLRTLKNQMQTLNALQGKGVDITKKNARTLGKVKQSVDNLERTWGGGGGGGPLLIKSSPAKRYAIEYY